MTIKLNTKPLIGKCQVNPEISDPEMTRFQKDLPLFDCGKTGLILLAVGDTGVYVRASSASRREL